MMKLGTLNGAHVWRLLTAVILVAVVPVRAEEKGGSSKKGFAGNLPAARAMKESWYYNWGLQGASEPGIEFVPMVKGKRQVNDKTLEAIKASGAKSLLGFNEPERSDQGDTTVEEALDLWPRLMATGSRLGSPATSSDGRGQAWMERFMEGVAKRKLRVDFIAVHWYRSANEAEFAKWLDGLHSKWRRPIWVTEFSAFYTKGDRVRFAEMSFNMLEHKTAVERYAYMDMAPGTPGALWKDGAYTDPTKLGEKLRDR